MFEHATNDIEDIIDAALSKGTLMMLVLEKMATLMLAIYQYHDEDDIECHPEKLEASEYYTTSLKLVEFLSIRRFTMADLSTFKEEQEVVIEAYA